MLHVLFFQMIIFSAPKEEKKNQISIPSAESKNKPSKYTNYTTWDYSWHAGLPIMSKLRSNYEFIH